MTTNNRVLDALKIAEGFLASAADRFPISIGGPAATAALELIQGRIAEAGAGAADNTEAPLRAIIREALDAWREEFDADTPIDGADLLEWFSGWRERAARCQERSRPDMYQGAPHA